MRLTYDPNANVACIRLREKIGDVETFQLIADFLVEINDTGAVCGIELLKATEQLTAGGDGKLIFVNHLKGSQEEVRVAWLSGGCQTRW